MTNAEKIAKDIDLMVCLIQNIECYDYFHDESICDACDLSKTFGTCKRNLSSEELRKWLEREAEE